MAFTTKLAVCRDVSLIVIKCDEKHMSGEILVKFYPTILSRKNKPSSIKSSLLTDAEIVHVPEHVGGGGQVDGGVRGDVLVPGRGVHEVVVVRPGGRVAREGQEEEAGHDARDDARHDDEGALVKPEKKVKNKSTEVLYMNKLSVCGRITPLKRGGD